jgi:hypothetical protein
MTFRPLLAAAAASVALLAIPVLTGCSAVDDALHSETELHFDDVSAMAGNWDRSAPWIPADARDIRIHESDSGRVAQVRMDSDEDVPAGCVPVERKSLPVFVTDWTPEDVVGIDTVRVCGDWAIAEVDGGWFGWTPTSPAETPVS